MYHMMKVSATWGFKDWNPGDYFLIWYCYINLNLI